MPYGDEKSYSFFKMKGFSGFGNSPAKHLTGKHPAKDGHTWGSHAKEAIKTLVPFAGGNPIDPGKSKKHTVKKIVKKVKSLF